MKWEIEPYPYDQPADEHFDIFETDSDDEVLDALRALVEKMWDEAKEGEQQILKLRLRSAK